MKPKTVRFADLVRTFGRPEMVTLWTDPQKNIQFSRAIDENRIVTVKQVNVGTRKDFGLIGFHKERNVSFLMFPKPLDYPVGTKVIGIKYDLITSPEPPDPLSLSDRLALGGPKTSARGGVTEIQRQKKTVQTFQVTIKVVAATEVTIDVNAADQAEARKKAQAQMAEKKVDFTKAQIQTRVRKVVKKQ